MWFVVDYDPCTVVAYLDLYLNEILPGVGYAPDRAEDLRTLRFPDSHDAYAGAALSLAARYVIVTGNLPWIAERGPELATIAEANILSQLKPNGLVRAYRKPHMNGTGYLMDQCECYAGLRDFGRALKLANDRSAITYAEAAARLGEAIHEVLYDPRLRAWHWSDSDSDIQQRWYPDLAAQIFPHLYGVVTTDRERDLTRYTDGYSFLCSGAPGGTDATTGSRGWSSPTTLPAVGATPNARTACSKPLPRSLRTGLRRWTWRMPTPSPPRYSSKNRPKADRRAGQCSSVPNPQPAGTPRIVETATSGIERQRNSCRTGTVPGSR